MYTAEGSGTLSSVSVRSVVVSKVVLDGGEELKQDTIYEEFK